GSHGAHCAWISERNRGALEIVGAQFALARTLDQIVESGDVFVEIQRAGVFDVGDQKAAGTISSRDVNSNAEVYLRTRDAKRLAVLFGVSVIDSGDFLQGLYHGPPDQMGVGNLAIADKSAVLVDDAPVFVHHFDSDGALRSGKRNRHAGGHIFGDARR